MNAPSANLTPAAQRSRSVFLALVFGALAVVIYLFAVEPTQNALKRAREELAALETCQTTIRQNLKGREALEARVAELSARKKDYEAALLTPLLESYAMRAKSILDPLAGDVDLRLSDYSERPVRPLPAVKPAVPKAQAYGRQPVRVTCTGTYGEIVSFLLRVEEQLPLVSLGAFTLKARNEPERQTADFVFEWPVAYTEPAAPKGGEKK